MEDRAKATVIIWGKKSLRIFSNIWALAGDKVMPWLIGGSVERYQNLVGLIQDPGCKQKAHKDRDAGKFLLLQ